MKEYSKAAGENQNKNAGTLPDMAIEPMYREQQADCDVAEAFTNTTILDNTVREALKQKRCDHMSYWDDMEVLHSTLLEEVLGELKTYEPQTFTALDVERALQKEQINLYDFGALLAPAARPYLETIAQRAKMVKEQWFGNTISLFTPLYLANYCENYCIYCGFNCHNTIRRAKLSMAEMEREMEAIAATGLQDILLLTGESRRHSDVKYIGDACRLAARYFRAVGLEIYPVNTAEYRYLHECGADYVTVFQETYNSDVYEMLHVSGHKRIFPYRFYAQERAVLGGMRGVGFAALLGLTDFRKDAFATGVHAYLLRQAYPHTEISFSCPRLRPIINKETIKPVGVGEAELLQVVCAYRLLIPSASITVSTRECPRVRDNMMTIAANKISAGVSTGIGSHSDVDDSGDEQFEISDTRSVAAVYEDLMARGLQPVMTDTVYVG